MAEVEGGSWRRGCERVRWRRRVDGGEGGGGGGWEVMREEVEGQENEATC